MTQIIKAITRHPRLLLRLLNLPLRQRDICSARDISLTSISRGIATQRISRFCPPRLCRCCWYGSMATKTVATKNMPTLELNELETRLRDLLKDVAAYANPDKPSELRFTGGWVRDKLLGHSSHDIDVAINDMTGYQFGLKMMDYLKDPEKSRKHRLSNTIKQGSEARQGDMGENLFSGLHKIEANPEKSKHLETVTTKVFGLEIDLVNLRKETYTEDSRNPQMEFGTPEEDALRRDATINAMFYNLTTGLVEDLTGQGLDDMKNKMIRTPLEPFQTFKDDPLRILRLIRFSSRFDYALDPEIERAADNQSIKDALKLKISRERVGVELQKMLQGPSPFKAYHLIDKLHLYSTVFTDPTAKSTFVPNQSDWVASYKALDELLKLPSSIVFTTCLNDAEQRYNAWLLSAFVPYFAAPVVETGKKVPKNHGLPAVAAAREGIKAPNKVTEIIAHSVRNADEIISVKDAFLKARKAKGLLEDDASRRRDTLGMKIRKWGISWKSQLLFALFLETTQREEGIHKEYEIFLLALKDLDLLNVTDVKPIINGNDLATAMNMSQGPWMKEALDVVMAWQLQHPDISDPKGAIDAVKAKQGELSSVLVHHFLQLTIRPLFATTKTQNITSQGRKVMAMQMPLPKRFEDTEYERPAQPWKEDRNKDALELLSWSVHCLDAKLVERHWPLLIPPILALVDDGDVVYKTRGYYLLHALLKVTPPEVLSRTGLSPVFEEALSPGLAYLPSLTSEEDSVKIIRAAYPALLELTKMRYPRKDPVSLDSNPNPFRERFQALLLILHSHILPSISHVSDSHPIVTTALLQQLQLLMKAMGIDTITQLIYLVPLTSALLESPFGPAAPGMLEEAAKTMQHVIASAWLRIWNWRFDILKALGNCWIQTQTDIQQLAQEDESRKSRPIRTGIDRTRLVEETEERSQSLKRVLEKLNTAAQMLISAVEATAVKEEGMVEVKGSEYGWGIDIWAEIEQLVAADERLKGLFAEETITSE